MRARELASFWWENVIVVDILLRVFSRKTSHKMLESLSFCDRDNSNKHNSANVSGDKTTTTTTKLSGESIFLEYAKTLSVTCRSRSCLESKGL